LKGNCKSYNPFSVLTHEELIHTAKISGIKLGSNQAEVNVVVDDILLDTTIRSKNFEEKCRECHVGKGPSRDSSNVEGGV
jgi:hypothetical protein